MNDICDICGLPFERKSTNQKRHNGACHREYYLKYLRKYNQFPKVKEYLRKYNQLPKVKEYKRKYHQLPKVKERRRKYQRKYQRKYKRKYRQFPKVKERERKWKQRNSPPSVASINFFQALQLTSTINQIKKNEPANQNTDS